METYDLHPTTSLHASRKGKGEGGGLVGPIRRLTETPNRMSHAFATHSFATYLTRRMYDHSSSSRCLAFDSIGMVCLPTGRTEQVLLLLRAVCTTKTGLLGPAASPRNRICMCSAYVCVSQMAHSLVLCRLLPLVRRRRPGGHWLPTVCLPTSSRRICACLYQPPTERSKSGDGGVREGITNGLLSLIFSKMIWYSLG